MTCSSQINSAAVIRLHSLGDVVLAQPAASELSVHCEVFFVTSEQYEPVISRMPGNIHPATIGKDAGPIDLRRLINEISPDCVVDLQNNIASGIATAGRHVKGRFRMDRKLRKRVMDKRAESMPLRSWEFMQSAGSDGCPDPVLERRSERGSEGLKIGIVTGGRWYIKSIPSAVISETSRILADLHGAGLVLLGGAEDKRILKTTAESAGRENIDVYCGEEGIEGLINTIEALDLLISPDSGPAHLASALGVPVLVVFTSTSPSLGFWRADRKGNYMVSNNECRPCHRHGGNSCRSGSEICRKGILPYHLAESAMEMLKS
ncbi:MAG: glycosyltransferase family 9 protein [Candidatus Aegiribacteria sp.]|nr:glycosyltransferase family 9 protein [Candidatus Aegiribacteria sp.]